MSKSNKFKWPDNVLFEPDAEKDFVALDNSQRLLVFKAILKVSSNPKPHPKGYGKPLSGNIPSASPLRIMTTSIRSYSGFGSSVVPTKSSLLI